MYIVSADLAHALNNTCYSNASGLALYKCQSEFLQEDLIVKAWQGGRYQLGIFRFYAGLLEAGGCCLRRVLRRKLYV